MAGVSIAGLFDRDATTTPNQVWTIFRHLYAYSAPLSEAIQCLQPNSNSVIQVQDCQEYKHFCTSVVVATDRADLFTSRSGDRNLICSSRIKHVIAKLVDDLKANQYYGRTLKSMLEHLHSRVGDTVLEKLLNSCSVFLPVKKGSVLQLTGPPIYTQFSSSCVHIKQPKTTIAPNTASRPISSDKNARRNDSSLGVTNPGGPGNQDDDHTHLVIDLEALSHSFGNHDDESSVTTTLERDTSVDCVKIVPTQRHGNKPTTDETRVTGASPTDCVVHCSSEELFSSLTTDNSVIIVSSSGNSYPSTIAGEVLAPSLLPSCEPLGSEDARILCRSSGNQLRTESSEIGFEDVILTKSVSSIESSDVDDILTGKSSDDDSDYLSNKAYRRKRQRDRSSEHAHAEPLSKRSRGNEAPKRRTNTHKSKGLSTRSKKKRKLTRKRKRALKRKSIPSKKSFGQAKFTRTRIFFATNLKEALSEKYVLNSYRATVKDARKLVTNIFLDKTRLDSSRIHGWRPVKPRLPAQSVNRCSIQRLSPRLHRIVPLLTKLLHNHKRKVRYHYLLKHYCPIPEGLLSTAKGQKSCLATKPGDVQLLPEAENGQSTSTNETPKEEELLGLVRAHLDHSQVLNFLRSILDHLVPPELWGSLHNKLVFYKHLKRFVDLRRWETMNVQQMSEGFKLSHCKWLQLPPSKHRGRPHPPEPQLFEKFVLWLIDEVVVRTIKTFFYATEHADYQNHVFYYRKWVWSRIQKLALQKTSIPYEPVSEDEMQMLFHFNRTLGISKLRFLPKVNGVRPIVNFGSKVKLPYALPGRRQLLDSVNYQLQDVFHVLNYEKTMHPELFGSTCFGHNDIHARLKKFVMEQRNSEHEKPLLFVRVDISNCYDSMLPDKMYDIIVKKILSKESYVIRRYTKVFISQNKIRRQFIRVATSKDSCDPFFKFAMKASESSSYQSCIFTDQGYYPEIKRSRVAEMLKKHLYGNIVRLGRQHYKQVQGIAQGSKVSTMLCGFYYADMEKACLPKIDSEKELLLRFVDDFFLITRDPEVAKQFLVTMNSGLPEYNCSINSSKSVTNFRLTEEGEVVYQKEIRWVEWCGLLVNTRTLEVRVDYSRYTMKNIRDNVTITLHGRHYHYFINFTKRAVRLRCLSLLLDCEVLSEKSVVINMYQGFLIAGVKYLAILTAMPNWTRRPPSRGWRRFTREEFRFFFRAAVNMFNYFWRQARLRCRKTSDVSTFTLSKELCVWLGCHSLKTVLTHHEPKQLSFLIRLLTCKVDSLSNQLAPDLLRRCFSATKRIDSSDIFTVRL